MADANDKVKPKDEVEDLSDAFESEEKIVPPDEPENVVDESEVEPSDSDAEKPEGESDEKSEEEPKKEFSWADFGLERYDDMDLPDVAKDIQDMRQRYGQQANKLGDLRKEFNELKESISTEKERPKKEDSFTPLTDGQRLDFNEMYEKNPAEALSKYAGPKLKEELLNEINSRTKETTSKQVEELLNKKMGELELQNFVSRNDDAEDLMPLMKELDKEDYLGKQRRPVDDLGKLARLGAKKDPMYKPVYYLMSNYPNMPFEQAQNFAKLQAGAGDSAKAKRNDIERTVKKVDSSNSSARTTKKQEEVKDAETIDEAFGM